MYFHKTDYPFFDGSSTSNKPMENAVSKYLRAPRSNWINLEIGRVKSAGYKDGKDFTSDNEYEDFWTNEVEPKFKNLKKFASSQPEAPYEFYYASFEGNPCVVIRPTSFTDIKEYSNTPNEYGTCIEIIARDDFPIKFEDLNNKQFSAPRLVFGTKQFANAMETIRQYEKTK